MEAATNGAPDTPAAAPKQLYAATFQLKANPFRSDRLALNVLEAIPRTRDFGCKGYSFIRSDQDKVVFFFVSYWEDKNDFQQWWFSNATAKLRDDLQGQFELHSYPSWHTVLDHTGITAQT